tara:strand:- start:518 stop:988 length:471 start_codon:yes stop_codon:yes gene_type:complete
MIYLIEDSNLKASQIESFLNSELRFAADVHVYSSFQSGLKALELVPPILAILDMTLPTFDRRPNCREGRLRPLGGYDILRKMRLKNIRSKVVILTQLESFGEGVDKIGFDEITEKCKAEFPDIFLKSIYFDQGGELWQDALREVLTTLKKDCGLNA